jgi:hypothetical protein
VASNKCIGYIYIDILHRRFNSGNPREVRGDRETETETEREREREREILLLKSATSISHRYSFADA